MTSDKTPATVSAVQGQENQIDPADKLADKGGQLQVEQQDGDADDDELADRLQAKYRKIEHLLRGDLAEQMRSREPGLQRGHQVKEAEALGVPSPWEGLCPGAEERVLAFLRFTSQHPPCSPEFALLLLAQLEDMRPRFLFSLFAPHEYLVLQLTFRTPGTAKVIEDRYLDELKALLAHLLQLGRCPGLAFPYFPVRDVFLVDRLGSLLAFPWPPEGPEQGGQG